jgi:hypothetical protein
MGTNSMTPHARPLFTAPQALPTFYLLPFTFYLLLRRLILDALSPPPSFPFG